jgi:DNA-binding HxlR family transcriptional regulator
MAKGLRDVRVAATAPETADLLDVSGRRWSLRVIWELRSGPMTFRELRSACGEISPGVLQSRLHEWRRFNVVESIPRLGYRLTVRGEQLFQLLVPVSEWAAAGHAKSPSQ